MKKIILAVMIMAASCNTEQPVPIVYATYTNKTDSATRAADSVIYAHNEWSRKESYYYRQSLNYWQKSMDAKFSGNHRADKKYWKIFLAYKDSLHNMAPY